MTYTQRIIEEFEELRKQCAGHYDISLPPEVRDFLTQALENQAKEIGEKISLKITDEPLFVGKTQYEFYKGNIRWVANQALNDIKNIIEEYICEK